MADNFSFDVVSELNFMEFENAINQAQKELAQRFDFKGSKSSIEYKKAEKKLVVVGDDEFKLNSVMDIIEGRLAKRGISIKCMDKKPLESSFEGTVRQNINLTSGLPKDKAKDLVAVIKGFNRKVQAQIEGEKVRVISSKKDELQAVMASLREVKFAVPLQFINFR